LFRSDGISLLTSHTPKPKQEAEVTLRQAVAREAQKAGATSLRDSLGFVPESRKYYGRHA
jgi:hypothetical protein